MPSRAIDVPGLPFPLEVHGPAAPAEPEVTGTQLRLTAGPGADLFLDPRGAADPRPDAERWTASVAGDFQLRAHVNAGFTSEFDSGVLIGWGDENNWFKLCAELDPAGMPRVVSVVSRDGVSDDCNSWPIAGPGIHLRISRSGTTAAMHTSEDAQRWSMVRYFALGLAADAPIRVGFLAQSPAGPGTWATFSDIAFTGTGLAELRDGS